MNKELFFIGIMATILFLAVPANHLTAQNSTTYASNVPRNVSVAAKQTVSELGQNVSSVLNKTGENVHSTLKELGQNVSNVGSGI